MVKVEMSVVKEAFFPRPSIVTVRDDSPQDARSPVTIAQIIASLQQGGVGGPVEVGCSTFHSLPPSTPSLSHLHLSSRHFLFSPAICHLRPRAPSSRMAVPAAGSRSEGIA